MVFSDTLLDRVPCQVYYTFTYTYGVGIVFITPYILCSKNTTIKPVSISKKR